MKIKKILNNNAVVLMDNGEEKIAIGSGIAFNKRKNDVINVSKIEKLFVMKEENERFQKLLLQVPEEHFAISEAIISYAEEYLGSKLNEHVYVALTDHLSFAIERVKEGVRLQNKLFQEIKALYKREYDIGVWAIRLIQERLNVIMPIDEAAYIALHIHTAKIQGGDLHETVRQTTIISDMVQTMKEFLNITIEDDDISYQRLITHLRFVITRVHHYELHTMDQEMLEMIKKKFPLAFKCSQEVAKLLKLHYELILPNEELGYISLHIERLRQRMS
ncbi:PRD domain-containing protein [Bacillus aquiflavi]|uniref:PRD domain-containing protein n=1 Tax=Bacillus aquiflavi TaxID=2672567 RepID=A0A6B3VZL1_9BACI|nr:PRD domain-containing protein [Bacillus aquiflavi]MBA4538340.1 PRD domain-containing protein [Bacillus aquiflavi]NEY82688.1 PRD domain-containing protein [Bacillus aquiflavi]UAC48655.1 PRD domain-containing protein [Bacillus aquiflavi]